MPISIKAFVSRIKGWLSPRATDQDIDEELRSHLDMLTEDNRRRGMAADAAARAARLRLGGMTQLKEQYRDRAGLPWIESLWQDARYALRLFGRSPGFTLLAVLTVAVGIGVNTTVFTLIDGVAFKRLPVQNANRLARIERWFESGARGDIQYAFSWDEYQHYLQHVRLLSDVIAVGWPSRVAINDGTLQGLIVSDNYFAALGATAMVGRTFLPTGAAQGSSEPVIVLSEAAWRTRFAADARIIGKPLDINRVSVTVIGVMPNRFIGTGNPPQVPDFWAPLDLQPRLFPRGTLRSRPDLHRLQLLAYRAPGTTAAQAEAELNVLGSQLAELPETHIPGDKTVRFTLQPATYFGGTDDLRFQAVIALVMTVVALILVAACANLANMLLARASARRREIAMRLALGATRARLVRQLLTENVLLAALGGAVGLVASAWASQALWTLVDQAARPMFFTDVPFVASMKPDLPIFGFSFGLSLVTGVVVGLSPALMVSQSPLSESVSQVPRSRVRSWSIAAQSAVAMLFLICAGLFVRAVGQSSSTQAGFDTRQVFMLLMGYDANPAKARGLQERIVDSLRRSSGIESVALVDRLPFAGTWSPPVVVDDGGRRLSTRTLANYVSPSYFQTAGISIERGRTFAGTETGDGSTAAIVSEAAARRFWPGEDPIGKRLSLDLTFGGQLTAFDVVGVVKDVRSANLSRVDPAYVYLPTRPQGSYNIAVRSAQGTRATYNAVRAVVESLDPAAASGLRVVNLQDSPMMQSQLFLAGLLARVAAALAGIAIVLAAVGVYGVTAYLVSQRTQEIGIRMALGATRGDVLGLVVRQGVTPVCIGALVGLVVAAAASTGLHSTLVSPSAPDLLFGVRPLDPVSFFVLPMVLAGVAAIASYVPARRATLVDPLLALRCE